MILRRELDPSAVRAYDIRGVVGQTIFPDDAEAVGMAFGCLVRKAGGKSVIVGHDPRITSPTFALRVIGGLRGAGIDVFAVGMAPSPLVYYAVHKMGADAGIVVTASHNPPDHNGFKFTLGDRCLGPAELCRLRDMVKAGIRARKLGREHRVDLLDQYVSRLAAECSPALRLRVAWDPANGAAAPTVTALAARLSGEHHVLNGSPDGKFPAHHPDPSRDHNLAQLRSLIRASRCDVGFAFDVDGDRLGVMDEKGRLLPGDVVLAILAIEVLGSNPGAAIVADVKAGRAFAKFIRDRGGDPVLCRTGHAFIKAKMREIGAKLGGEVSGHICFSDTYYGYDDAPFAAVRLLNVLTRAKSRLSELFDVVSNGSAFSPELRFYCEDARKFSLIDEIKSELARQGRRICDIDGVRVDGPEGWWLVRASNTEPAIAARCEAINRVAYRRVSADLKKIVRFAGLATQQTSFAPIGCEAGAVERGRRAVSSLPAHR